MEKNNLFTLLKSLSKDEVKDFKKFIASRYFSTGRDLTKYYNVIIKYYPGFTVTKEILRKDYFKTSKDEKKQLKILRTLNSDMIKVLENYFLVKVLKRNRYYSTLMLVEDYWFRKLFTFGQKKYNDFVKNPFGVSVDFNKHLQLYLLTNPMFNILAFSQKESALSEIYKVKSDLILSFFLGASSALMNNLTANENMYNVKEYKNLFKIFMKYINFEEFLSELDVQVEGLARLKIETYILICYINLLNFDKYFDDLSALYQKLFNKFNDGEKVQYFMRILNLYTNTGRKHHLQSKFELIKFAVDAGLFPQMEFKYLHWQYYKMFLQTGLFSNNLNWAEEFYKSYINKTDPAYRETLNNFSLALLNHYKGNFEESLKYLNDVKLFTDAIALDVKLMQIKNYYKLMLKSDDYYETLSFALDALRHYVDSSKKMNKHTIAIGNSFINAMRILSKYRISDDKNKENLIPDIIKLRPSIRNFWLIDEFTEILD